MNYSSVNSNGCKVLYSRLKINDTNEDCRDLETYSHSLIDSLLEYISDEIDYSCSTY